MRSPKPNAVAELEPMRFFVVGLAGPLDRVALGEDRGAHLFGDADGVARRDALRGRAHELGGEIAVHARERVGP